MNLCTTIQNHHLVYLLALQWRRVGQDRRGSGTRESGQNSFCVLAFHWLPSPGWTSPFWGREHFFRALGVQKVFPFTHIPNKSSSPGCWDNNQTILFAEIRSSKMPTAEQGPFTMSAPEERCVINLELMEFVIILRIFIVQILRILPLSFIYCWTYGDISCILCKRQSKLTMLT